ncbi:ABC transporter ATP-binding protein [Chelatococcus reniformis]|uniref:ABC transporter ATP-binding protein n=1 Tax=Chelatococcus reniformis TaxID=1494448 RepID=A0A916XFS7_9HYPH|nr:ABC transporter ATP-binding protein [Chelatococcus reniformis]GGC70138.1 ABC transporter ATP-binding protein [Chelatococcus reniformis]
MATASTTLEVDDLHAGYRGRPVLAGLALAPVRTGTIAALVGPNGAGKSTLLRALCGLVPARGRVGFGGVDLLGLGPGERARHIGFMPQNLPSTAALTVLESVISALKAGAEPASGDARLRALAALHRLGIAHLAMEQLGRLSGGQLQLANLAQAIAREPPLLLLDEPTSALDLHYQLRVIGAVRTLADEGRIVVVVLHDLAFAARWSDHIVVLDKGRLHSQGAPQKVITAAMLRDVYHVEARVERCSNGRIQIMADGLVA